MFVLLLKYFFFNTFIVAEGFGLALLLREQYRRRGHEPQEEAFDSEPSESLVPETVEESPASSTTEPVAVAEDPESPHDSSHHKVDEVDEALLPKGFKVDTVLGNMQTTQVPNEADSPDFSVVVHESDPYSAAAAFEDDDEYEDSFSPPISSEAGSLPPIDYGPADEPPGDSEESRGVSPLAAELLGEDFDFQSLTGTSTPNDEPPDESIVAETPKSGGDDEDRTESVSLPDNETHRELMPPQWIEPAFSREMVDVLLVEPDRPIAFVFTVETPPMLAKRRKNKPA